MMRFVVVVAGLTAVYALALASADPWDLGIGAVLSAAVLLAFGRFILPERALPPRVALNRTVRFPVLAVAMMGLIVRGTIQVARAVLSGASARHAGFVTLARGDRTPIGVIVNGMIETLSPGSVLVDVDPIEDTWTMHVLDASDEDDVRANIDRFYRRFQRPVWP